MRLPRNADVMGLYVLLAIGLLAPMASNTVLPFAPDNANHTAFVIEAKRALDEGQMPLRVAPFALTGLRYPLFQFYGQTPHLVAALVYKYLTPSNPWRALKIVYFVGLCLGAFLVFKLGEFLGFDRAIAVLTGVVYVTAPYLLVNIHARGAYTEAFAQLALPALAYSSVRLTMRRRAIDLVWTSLSWLAIGTAHLITFVYGTIFYLLFVATLTVCRRIAGRTAAILVAACALGWSLAAFQWYPVVMTPLRVHHMIGDVFKTNWLTPGAALLSLTSDPPEPLGGLNIPALHPALGLPMLIACAGVLYWRRELGPHSREIVACAALFSLAAFGAWSPVNFWAFLPAQLHVIQFTYRLLTFSSVFGTMLFAYFMAIYTRRLGFPGFLPCLVVLVLLCQSYLPVLPRNNRSLASIIATPETSYAGDAYEFAGVTPESVERDRGRYETLLPLVYGDGWLKVGSDMELARPYLDAVDGHLVLSGTAWHLDRPCVGLTVTLDGEPVATRNVEAGPFEWRVTTSAFRPFFHSETGQLGFRSDCWFVPSAVIPKSTDTRKLWIRIENLRFEALHPAGMPVAQVRPECAVARDAVVCDLNVPAATEVQLPMFYYPRLLRVRVDGHAVDYYASYYGEDSLAAVTLDAGKHRVIGRFSGSAVGNAISAASGGLLLLLAGWGVWRQRPGARLGD